MAVAGVFEHEGCRLHYWIDGPDGAPLVAFSHGAMADHTLFDDQVEAVVGRYRMLRWDMRGHGLSRPADPAFDPARAAADLSALLDHLGEARVLLVGQSIGGNVSQEFILREPDRVIAAVLLDCTCSTWPISRSEQRLLRLAPAMMRAYPASLMRWQATTFSSEQPQVRRRFKTMIAPLTRAELAAIAGSFATAVRPDPSYRIPVPILIVHGERDRLGNIARIAAPWAARDPHASLAVIPKAGHLANMDEPAAFNALLLAYLDEQVRTARSPPPAPGPPGSAAGG